MFLKTTEYALRAVVFLAASSDRCATNQQISESVGVSVGYLSKVLQTLARKGIVKSQRGPTGGFTLLRAADELTLMDIIEAVQPIRRVTECPLSNKAHQDRLCPLHQRLDDAAKLVHDWFDKTTVAELLAEMYEHPDHPEERCAFLGPIPPSNATITVKATAPALQRD